MTGTSHLEFTTFLDALKDLEKIDFESLWLLNISSHQWLAQLDGIQ